MRIASGFLGEERQTLWLTGSWQVIQDVGKRTDHAQVVFLLFGAGILETRVEPCAAMLPLLQPCATARWCGARGSESVQGLPKCHVRGGPHSTYVGAGDQRLIGEE